MIQIAGVVSKRCVRLGHYPKDSSKKIKVIDVLGAKIKLQSPVQCIQTDALSLCFGTINHGVQLRNIGLVCAEWIGQSGYLTAGYGERIRRALQRPVPGVTAVLNIERITGTGS